MFNLPAIGAALAAKILVVVALAFALMAGTQTWRLHSLEAEIAPLKADNTVLAADKANWKRAHADQVRAAGGWKLVAEARGQLLDKAIGEAERLADANRTALAQVQAAKAREAARAREAQAVLDQAQRSAPCKAALVALDHACPSLESF